MLLNLRLIFGPYTFPLRIQFIQGVVQNYENKLDKSNHVRKMPIYEMPFSLSWWNWIVKLNIY
jgi:hypothetical protein